MAELEISIKKALQHEGFYSNDEADLGGETLFGISRSNWPHWEGWDLVDAAKQSPGFPESLRKMLSLHELVLRFYKQNFSQVGYEQIRDQEILDELFDFGVNIGRQEAVRALQRSLQRFVAGPVVADGILGEQTVGGINAIEPQGLLSEFRARQSVHYANSVLSRFISYMKHSGVSLPEATVTRASHFATKYILGWERRIMS